MTTPKRAKLKHIKWDANQKSAKDGDPSKTVDVQFNPQTLKVSFSNKNAGGDQPGGSSKQFVGSGTTKLSVELLFDTTADGTDVRKHTEAVAFYIKADAGSGSGSGSNRVPPGVQFEWGSFIFRGTIESMDETLEYFSEEGVPLRANISLSISRQEIEFLPGEQGEGGGGGVPLETAQFRDSIQGLAGRNGKSGDWKGIAAANNIDDPLRLSAGALINVNAGVGLSAGAGLSVGGSVRVGGSVGVSISGGAGVSGSALAKASASAGVSARAAATASVGASTTTTSALGGGSAGAGASLKLGR
ncbi:MAG TPA: hypothetical protein VF588_00395 [Pyrinomonadaceae bacterium]